MGIDDTIYPKFYSMDPETEELLFDGFELKDGMVVLIESPLMRGDLSAADSNEAEMASVLANNRWCTVSNIYNHRKMVEFVGTYGDGSKRKRTQGVRWAWLVKKDSIPTA